MHTQFAERASFAGGPNAEMVGFAGGLNDISAPVTHENDHRLPETFMSRLDHAWRMSAKKRLAQAAAFFVFSAGISACTGGESDTPTTHVPGVEASPIPGQQSTTETAAPQLHAECYDSGYANLSAIQQEECRRTIAGLSLNEVTQLPPIDQTRWAHYYRYVVTGEPTPISNELIPAATLEKNDSAASIAGALLFDYQESVYKMAWLLQNNASVCADSRTLKAMLGSKDTSNPDLLLAQNIARAFPSGTKNLQDYATSLYSDAPLFKNQSITDVDVSKAGEVYQLKFTAKSVQSRTDQQFTFALFPYVNQLSKENGVFKEGMITYDSPDAQKVFEKLHKRLIVSTPQIAR